jgi:hypothetical protein
VVRFRIVAVEGLEDDCEPQRPAQLRLDSPEGSISCSVDRFHDPLTKLGWNARIRCQD